MFDYRDRKIEKQVGRVERDGHREITTQREKKRESVCVLKK